MRALVLAALVLLAGCASPYQHALNNSKPERPQPPLTAADLRALTPYQNSRLFPNYRASATSAQLSRNESRSACSLPCSTLQPLSSAWVSRSQRSRAAP